jgi:hypothetical protein
VENAIAREGPGGNALARIPIWPVKGEDVQTYELRETLRRLGSELRDLTLVSLA